MKKLTALFLALLMLVTVFTACGKDSKGATVEDAVKYLQAMYNEDDGSVTAKDYKVVGLVNIEGTVFNITWTTDKEAVKVTPDADGKMVTIDVNEESPEAFEYTLTATVADAKGKTATASFKHSVPKYEELTIAAIKTMEDGANIVVKGTVVDIDTPWSDSYNNISVVIKDTAGDTILCYRLATKVELGDVILVKGTVGSYNGEKQIAAGATAEIKDHVTITVDYPEKTIVEALAAEDGTNLTIKGTVTSIKSPWSTQYNNMDVWLEDDAGNKILIFRLGLQVEVGDQLTVKGKVGSYEGEKQIAQGATAEKTGHVEITVTYPEKTIAEAIAAEDGTTLTIKGVVTKVGEWNTQYNNMDVTITDATGSILVFRCGVQVKLNDYIVVKGAVGSYKGDKQIAEKAEIEVTGTYTAATVAEAKAKDDGALVIVTGTVTGIADGDVWNDQYGNMSVTITDAENNTLYVFRLATKVELGDELTVYGKVSTYNSAKQIGGGGFAIMKAAATITFDNTEKRTTISNNTQVWTENGITFTNNKASAQSNVNGDYFNPVRCYMGSSIQIDYTGMKKIVINCNSSEYATNLKNSITDTGVTVTVEGKVVTITFTDAVNTFSVASLSAKVFINSIEVYTEV